MWGILPLPLQLPCHALAQHFPVIKLPARENGRPKANQVALFGCVGV